jgi:DNA invertase Pin-like site-specific DNA recombinase
VAPGRSLLRSERPDALMEPLCARLRVPALWLAGPRGPRRTSITNACRSSCLKLVRMNRGNQADIARVFGYVRVSTAEQGRSGLGLATQRSAIATECRRHGWELLHTYTDVASGKSTNGRGEFGRMLDDLAARKADGIVVSKLDRLSRSIVDFGRVLKLSQRHGWAIRLIDFDLDTSTPTGKLMANLLISVAEWERDIIGQRTRDGLAETRAKGTRLGRERQIEPALEKRIVRMRQRGASFQAIATKLDSEQVPTSSGKAWHWATIQRVVRRHRDEPIKTRRRRAKLD